MIKNQSLSSTLKIPALKVMVYLSRLYHFRFFKCCLPQISLGPFLNTLSNMISSIFSLVADPGPPEPGEPRGHPVFN